QASDLAGNLSTATNLTFTLDASSPTLTAALASDTGSSSTDLVTSNATIGGQITDTPSSSTTFALTGSADGGSTISLGNVGTSFTLNSAGSFGLANGAHILHLQVADLAGNLSSISDVTFTLDASSPTLTTSLASDTGSSNSDFITS